MAQDPSKVTEIPKLVVHPDVGPRRLGEADVEMIRRQRAEIDSADHMDLDWTVDSFSQDLGERRRHLERVVVVGPLTENLEQRRRRTASARADLQDIDRTFTREQPRDEATVEINELAQLTPLVTGELEALLLVVRKRLSVVTLLHPVVGVLPPPNVFVEVFANFVRVLQESSSASAKWVASPT